MKLLLEAAFFAACKHRTQRRKNTAGAPYINHCLEVARHLAVEGGVDDETILCAAILHDTVEDTDTSKEELTDRFGQEIAGIVMECTDDKALPKAERKRLQIGTAPTKSKAAKQVKMADKTCNLTSLLSDPPVAWSEQRQSEYFLWAEKVCEGLRGVNPRLDEAFDGIMEKRVAPGK